MYLAGKDKCLAQKLGGDDASMEKVGQYFSGTMLEARKWLGREDNDEEGDDDEGADEGESDGESSDCE